ncbi:MAG: hypothetical protein M3Y42_01375 [Actinomycetota bacterium]|nr:hypothetical protein [Actinomycetota bacterium]MDQ2955600.1 hypothetical protein [Actinomycetota bacterium]
MDTDQGGYWLPPQPGFSAAQAPVLPPGAPTPPRLPAGRTRRGKLLAAAVLCTLVAALLSSVAVGQFRSDHAPRAVVKRYFAALASGDAPAALALAVNAPQGDYLTDLVLHQQLTIAKFSNVNVRGTVVHGSSATTQVSYQLRFSSGVQQINDAVDLVKQGSSWRLSRAATSIDLTTGGTGSHRLTFAGRPVPNGRLLVFPGALPVATDNPAVRPAGQPMIRLIDDGQATDLSALLTADAERSLDQALSKALTSCLTGSSKDPNCPVADDSRSIPGSLRGTAKLGLSGAPGVSLSGTDDGRVDLTGTVYVKGAWKIWDFNNQVVNKNGVTDVQVQAVASIKDLNTVYWTVQS